MRAGVMRHSIELQANSPGLVDHEKVENWKTFAIVNAQKLEPKGEEVAAALQNQASLTVVFNIRYRSDVSPANRVLFDGRLFDVRAALNPDGRNRTLQLHCTEHKTNGA